MNAASEASREEISLRYIIANILGSVLILGLGVSGLLYFGAKPEVPQDEGRGDSGGPPLVETAEVVEWNAQFFLDVSGEATSHRVITVGAEVSGLILTKSESTRTGLFVRQGEVLYTIDPVNYQLEEEKLLARVHQAEEDLRAVDVDTENAAALLKLAEEDRELQRLHLQRVQNAYSRKAASETELDTALRAELTARNTIQSLSNQISALQQAKKLREAGLRLAASELERTRVDLLRCTVRSPITGSVVEDLREIGDYIRPGDTLLRINDTSRMEVRCSLRGSELSWIWQYAQSLQSSPVQTSQSLEMTRLSNAEAAKSNTQTSDSDPRATASAASPGTSPAALSIRTGDIEDASHIAAMTDAAPAQFQLPEIPCEVVFEFDGVQTVWAGRLSRFEGTGLDRATRMLPCRVIVDEPETSEIRSSRGVVAVSPPALINGMYVTVRIPVESPVPLIRVPVEAIRPGAQIWCVRNEKLYVIPVQIVRAEQQFVLVRQQSPSLLPGDQVIISPLASITEGMPVVTGSGRNRKPAEPDVPDNISDDAEQLR